MNIALLSLMHIAGQEAEQNYAFHNIDPSNYENGHTMFYLERSAEVYYKLLLHNKPVIVMHNAGHLCLKSYSASALSILQISGRRFARRTVPPLKHQPKQHLQLSYGHA